MEIKAPYASSHERKEKVQDQLTFHNGELRL